jgi:YD repeat-containing protein
MVVRTDSVQRMGTVSYGDDDASRRTSITYPGGSNQVTYAYDSANRLSTVTDWNSKQTSVRLRRERYTYDDANRMMVTATPNARPLYGVGLRPAAAACARRDGSQYVYGNGQISLIAGGSTYHHLTGGRGSVMKTTDSTGAVVNASTHDVYGNRADQLRRYRAWGPMGSINQLVRDSANAAQMPELGGIYTWIRRITGVTISLVWAAYKYQYGS